jgi:diguanylate cyclase (GGDEF)-like protein
VNDRRLTVALVAGLVGLGAGLAAAVSGEPAVGIVAGVAALGAAVAAGALAADRRRLGDALHEAGVECDRFRRELAALSAALLEDRHVDTSVAAPAGGEWDPGPALLEERFFPVIVRQRVAAARRQLQPVSVAILRIDGIDELAAARPEAAEQAMSVLAEVVRTTLRECDAACRLGDTDVAAVLEDTAEAGAVWAVERVRGTLQRSPAGEHLTISAGIACYPSHALGPGELVRAAQDALATARAAGRDRLEVAPGD